MCKASTPTLHGRARRPDPFTRSPTQHSLDPSSSSVRLKGSATACARPSWATSSSRTRATRCLCCPIRPSGITLVLQCIHLYPCTSALAWQVLVFPRAFAYVPAAFLLDEDHPLANQPDNRAALSPGASGTAGGATSATKRRTRRVCVCAGACWGVLLLVCRGCLMTSFTEDHRSCPCGEGWRALPPPRSAFSSCHRASNILVVNGNVQPRLVLSCARMACGGGWCCAQGCVGTWGGWWTRRTWRPRSRRLTQSPWASTS